MSIIALAILGLHTVIVGLVLFCIARRVWASDLLMKIVMAVVLFGAAPMLFVHLLP